MLDLTENPKLVWNQSKEEKELRRKEDAIARGMHGIWLLKFAFLSFHRWLRIVIQSSRSAVGQSRSSAGIKLTSNCSMLVVKVSYSEHHVVYSVEVSKIILFRRKCIVVIRLGFQRLIMNILIK
ncbi:hypothetical protein ES288_A05G384600v1 [Gossypium darwinii]|nr:hypothetical protein ES288_A05G384600v1 [Gossypium darwinii]